MISIMRGMCKDYLLSDMGLIPASEIEPPADHRVAHRKTPTVSRNSRVIAVAITIDLESDENMTVAFRATVFHFQPAILVSQQKDKECGLLKAAESEVRYEEGFDRDCIYY